MRWTAYILMALTVAACDSSSPVTPVTTVATSIQSASVLVGGQAVQGGVVSGEAGQTLFRVMLRDRDALHLENVEHCEVRYDLPGMGHMSGRLTGEQLCYDDGTHGDEVAGDGIFHYLDMDESIGCGRAGMPNGSYEYRFHCQFSDGSESEVSTTVTRQ